MALNVIMLAPEENELAGFTIAELKEEQRDLAKRLESESEATEKPRTCAQCHDRSCFGGVCTVCLETDLGTINRELHTRNETTRPRQNGQVIADVFDATGKLVANGGKIAIPAAFRRDEAPERSCSVCGGSISSNNRIGICSSTPECKNKAQNARYAIGAKPKASCSVCKGPLRADNKHGICDRNPECRRHRQRDQRAASDGESSLPPAVAHLTRPSSLRANLEAELRRIEQYAEAIRVVLEGLP